MDIKKFAVQETSVLALLGPDRQPLMGDDKQPLTVTVYGPGSKQYSKAQAANASLMLGRLKMNGRIDTEGNAEFLAAVTKEFSPNVEYDGLKGEDMFRAIYADNSVGFIAEQVTKHVGEWKNFMKASPAS